VAKHGATIKLLKLILWSGATGSVIFVWLFYMLMFDPCGFVDTVCWLREIFIGAGCINDIDCQLPT